MAPSNWGGIVDLTLDSDDDEGSLNVPASLPKKKPKKTPVPLPENVRHLYGSNSTTNPTSLAIPASFPPNHSSHRARSTEGHSSKVPSSGTSHATCSTDPSGFRSPTRTSPPTNGQHKEINHAVTAVWKERARGFPERQAAKRRKLSAPAPQSPATTHPCASPGAFLKGDRNELGSSSKGKFEQTDCRLPATQKSPTPPIPTASKTNAAISRSMNQTPSVHSLNTALKTNGAELPFTENALASLPRVLEFSRAYDGVENSVAPTTTARASRPETHRVSVNPYAFPHDVEEMLLDKEDEDIFQDFAFRTSPLKKPNLAIKDQTMRQSPKVRKNDSSSPDKFGHNPAVSPLPRSVSTSRPDNRDSVLSESADGERSQQITITQSQPLDPLQNGSTRAAIDQVDGKRLTGQFSEEESHLLIFLKEVKRLTWKEITNEFTKHILGRSYPTLQTHYSSRLNKRDRSQDPATLILPACYSNEATVDWAAVHEGTPRSSMQKKPRGGVAVTQQQVHSRHRRDPFGAGLAFRETTQEYSSSTESVPRRGRPQRAVPVKDYTWPRRRGLSQADDEVEEDDFGSADQTDAGMHFKEADLAVKFQAAPEKAIPVDNQPITMEFNEQDATLALPSQKRHGERLPYLASTERAFLECTPLDWSWDQLSSRDWQGSLTHVDFSPAELDIVERAITRILGPHHGSRLKSRRKLIQRSLRSITEPKLLQLANELRSHLRSRSSQSIDAFLLDAQSGQIRSTIPRVERLGAARPKRDTCSEPKLSMSTMIRQRELGAQSTRGWRASSRPLTYQLKNQVQQTLGIAFAWTGASSDVHAVGWSLDSQSFAAGAICVDDPHSMQYNRPNNLLFGNLTKKAIHELGEHYVNRERTESGPNSTHAMHASQDPKLYKTVSSVAFSPDGRLMFSGGYDQKVWVWELKTDGSPPESIIAMQHRAEIDMLAMNQQGLLATASKKGTSHAIKVMSIPEDPTQFVRYNFSSQKATLRPDLSILPTSLQFSSRDENLLLAGFGANVRQDGRDTNGDICLWDVNAHKQLNVHGSGKNVFDLSFHARNRWFAVGCVAGQNVNRGTRSIVRIYDELGDSNKYSMGMELECNALDMNDVVWCPGDDFLVAAGCTSGRAYVWDLRRPDQFLRELAHGRSTMPLDDNTDREISDTGIRFLSWGDNATRLYTGSSDGVVKTWNVVRSEEETFVKDLVTVGSGIMSGSFSPDKSKLLLGGVDGSVNILEVGRDDFSASDVEKLRFTPYDEPYEEDTQDLSMKSTEADPRNASAADLITSGQMMTVPAGGLPIRQTVQGPEYSGPYDNSLDAPFLREQALKFQEKMGRMRGSPCNIPLCEEAATIITSEELGDSGRGIDRIPDELRLQRTAVSTSVRVFLGKSQCSNCGRPARPSTYTTDDDVRLCELCSFACFRCGAANEIPLAAQTIVCNACKREWGIGSLGYEWMRETCSVVDHSSVPFLTRYGRELMRAKEQPLDESFGDEMNALSDYYHNLFID